MSPTELAAIAKGRLKQRGVLGRVAAHTLSIAAELRRLYLALAERLQPRSLRATVAWYLILFVGLVAAVQLDSYRDVEQWQRPSATGRITQKVAYYADHARDFDLVFLGDSRTYCGLHPDHLDPLLGSRSINLARWAHWFPTQFPQIQDLVPLIPPGTTVVWTIGHQNFYRGSASVRRNYPIGFANALRYAFWDYPLERLFDNVFYYTPGLQYFALADSRYRRIETWFDRKVWRNAEESANHRKEKARLARYEEEKTALQTEFGERPGVAEVWVNDWRFADNRTITSVSLIKAQGGYERVELRPEFFRDKQREFYEERRAVFEGRPPLKPITELRHRDMWNTFVAALDLFQAHDIDLIVNEIEEAPHTYVFEHRKQAYRHLMRTVVQPYVESRGIPYIRVDWDLIVDSDYFDYNHLNSVGIEKYTHLLAAQLQPLLAARGRTEARNQNNGPLDSGSHPIRPQ